MVPRWTSPICAASACACQRLRPPGDYAQGAAGLPARPRAVAIVGSTWRSPRGRASIERGENIILCNQNGPIGRKLAAVKFFACEVPKMSQVRLEFSLQLYLCRRRSTPEGGGGVAAQSSVSERRADGTEVPSLKSRFVSSQRNTRIKPTRKLTAEAFFRCSRNLIYRHDRTAPHFPFHAGRRSLQPSGAKREPTDYCSRSHRRPHKRTADSEHWNQVGVICRHSHGRRIKGDDDSRDRRRQNRHSFAWGRQP